MKDSSSKYRTGKVKVSWVGIQTNLKIVNVILPKLSENDPSMIHNNWIWLEIGAKVVITRN